MHWLCESQVLLRSKVSEGLVWSDGVVDAFPGSQSPVEGLDLKVTVIELIELLGMSALCALDMAIEFGRARRQHEQRQPLPLAGLLKDGLELTAAIDLNSPYSERHPLEQLVEESAGGSGGGPCVYPEHVPS